MCRWPTPPRAACSSGLGSSWIDRWSVLPRLLLNELELMQELAAGRAVIPAEDRDPVCGMSVSPEAAAPQARFHDVAYRFCSNACREQFLREPRHYVGRTRPE